MRTPFYVVSFLLLLLDCASSSSPTPATVKCPGGLEGSAGASVGGGGGGASGSAGSAATASASGTPIASVPGQICDSQVGVMGPTGDACAACLGSVPACCTAFEACDNTCQECLYGLIDPTECMSIPPLPAILYCVTGMCASTCGPMSSSPPPSGGNVPPHNQKAIFL